ncbi:MAG TPA: endonuclease/exonuclease/phosphatase family protein [Actinomycetota bacterium]|nr:endonuclease/exonuclease/phosphatase family protein [Actinomycetota bacterium]
MAPTPSSTGVWRWGRWSSEGSAPPPTFEHPEVRFLEFNMCGSACNQGNLVGVVNATRDSILSYRPDVVLLNEVCLGQADRLVELLALRGFPVSGCFGATTRVSRCTTVSGERWYGNAVLTRGAGIGTPAMIRLPNRPGLAEQRSVISMAAEIRGVRALVSATHLTPRTKDELYNRLQIAELASIQNQRALEGNVVVFGGDLNAAPSHLQELYQPAGRFREVDYPRNRATYSIHKIDFIFLNVESFFGLSGKVTRSRWSDHRPLRGAATLRAG